MNEFLKKNHRLAFFGLWLLLALMQAGLTELQDDEAYYWVFSKYLDWGYFDHPPMTALLVKMGYAIFHNELGVRLFPLLLNLLALLIIEKLIDRKNQLLFYGIVLSIAIIQVMGFLAVPDIPLIFFTALFFLRYKRFIEKHSWANTILLALSITFLFYSKYHAVLILLFTLLSNLKILRGYKIYIAGFIALLLFSPHLWWQYQHDWISFKYHLFESNVNPYKFSYTLEYLGSQLLLPGPIAGFILLPAAFLYRSKNETEKALKFTMIGIYAFFLLSSFRGKVEANWTSPVLVSLIVLSHQYLNEKARWRKWLFKLLPLTLFLVLFIRIVLVVDILPVKGIQQRFHAWKEWPAIMREKTKDLPIVFSNSYQRAAKYWFYSGQMTYSQNLVKGRRNNFNFWPVEDSLLGKPVYFLDIYDMDRFTDSIKTAIGWVGYKYDSSFASFAKVKIIADEMNIKAGSNDSIMLHAVSDIPSLYHAYIISHPQLESTIFIEAFNRYQWLKEYKTSLTLNDIVDNKFTVGFVPRLPKGNYYLRFAIQAGAYNATHNSEKIKLVVQ